MLDNIFFEEDVEYIKQKNNVKFLCKFYIVLYFSLKIFYQITICALDLFSRCVYIG